MPTENPYIYIGEDDSLNIYEHSVAVLQYLLLKLPEQTENSNPVARVPLPQGHLLCMQINARIMDAMNGKYLDLRLGHESNQKIAAKSVRFPNFLHQVIA